MLPYIHIGKFVFESYTLFINLGTLTGAFLMYMILDRYCREEKYWWKLIVLVLASMVIGSPVARVVKGMFYNGNGTATHFIGRVLVTCVLAEICFCFFWKNESCRLQAGNAVVMYLAVQHLFNRISCFMNGCCGGKYIQSLNMNFPSQLTEAACMFVLITLIAASIHRRRSFYYQFYIMYAVCIFLSEFLIEDTRVGVVADGALTGVQIGSCALLVLAVAFYIFHTREKTKSNITLH